MLKYYDKQSDESLPAQGKVMKAGAGICLWCLTGYINLDANTSAKLVAPHTILITTSKRGYQVQNDDTKVYGWLVHGTELTAVRRLCLTG